MATKYFEALDVPRFAVPNVLDLDPIRTSANIRERLAGKGFMSYDPLWTRMKKITSEPVSEADIEKWWNSKTLIYAMTTLNLGYGQEGSWYGFKRIPRDVLGVMMKPSVKGVLFRNGRAEAHIINPRKGQILSEDDFRFLGRAAYEEHCRNDPNDPVPVVVDTSEVRDKKGVFSERRNLTLIG
jgi:hypothetical protein